MKTAYSHGFMQFLSQENWSKYPKNRSAKCQQNGCDILHAIVFGWMNAYSNFYSFGVVLLRHILFYFLLLSCSHWSGWAVHCTYWLKMDEQKFKIKNTLIALYFWNVCRSVDYYGKKKLKMKEFPMHLRRRGKNGRSKQYEIEVLMIVDDHEFRK